MSSQIINPTDDYPQRSRGEREVFKGNPEEK